MQKELKSISRMADLPGPLDYSNKERECVSLFSRIATQGSCLSLSIFN